MNKWIVRVVMAFTALWKRLGVHPGQLAAILLVKLTIDDRSPGALMQARQRSSKPNRNRSIWTIIISGVFGGVYLFVFSLARDPVSGLTLYFLMFMVMLSITLISDFTSVLIDVKDNFIILPKPVNARTVLVARLLHILIHLGKIVLPMSLGGLVYFSITYGPWGALLYFADVILATLICIFLINGVYLLIMRFTTVERFKDIIGGVQIGFSVLVFALYYLGPRLAAQLALSQEMILERPYTYVAPPLWLAALWEVLRHPATASPLLWMLGAAGLLLPPLLIWWVIKYLAPEFDRKLTGLSSGSAPERPRATASKTIPAAGTTKPRPLYKLMADKLTAGSAEASGFEIAWLLTGRSRDFKLKVYPSFAYVIVYFFYVTLNHTHNTEGSVSVWSYLASSRTYVLLIYLSCFALIAAITNLIFSDKYKAAWVYYVTPVRMPGQILAGSVKAMLVKYFLPFYAAVAIFALTIWGPAVLPDLVLGLVNVAWFGMLMGYIYVKRFPFSAPPTAQAGTGRFLRNMFIFIVPTVTGMAHYLLRRYFPGQLILWIFLALSCILVWLIYSRYREVSWTEIEID